MALHSWDHEELNWKRFSAKCPEKFDDTGEECEAQWDTFKSEGADRLTIGSLFYWAAAEGWSPLAADSRARVPLTPDWHVVLDATLAAIPDHPEVYRRGSLLVRVIDRTQDEVKLTPEDDARGGRQVAGRGGADRRQPRCGPGQGRILHEVQGYAFTGRG